MALNFNSGYDDFCYLPWSGCKMKGEVQNNEGLLNQKSCKLFKLLLSIFIYLKKIKNKYQIESLDNEDYKIFKSD